MDRMNSRRRWAPFLAAGLMSLSTVAVAAPQWLAAWATSPAGPTGIIPAASVLREVISPRRAGDTVRLHLSNRGGVLPVSFSQVWLGAQLQDAALVAGSNKQLSFGGKSALTLQPGEDVVSDPIPFHVEPFAKLAVSMQASGPLGIPATSAAHPVSRETNYFSPLFGSAANESGAGYTAFTLSGGLGFEASWHYIDGLDVLARVPHQRTIVAFGDSITDGLITQLNSTVTEDLSGLGNEERYPDFLQQRFAASRTHRKFAIVNAGIAGNRLLRGPLLPFFGPRGLDRVENDVIPVAGVTDVVVHIGINDLGFDPTQPLTTAKTARELIAGYELLVSRLHSAGLRVILGTMMPARGAIFSSVGPLAITGGGLLFGTRAVDNARREVNAWARTQTIADGMVDFDACTRDTPDTGHLRADIDSGDHVHPNAAGYQVMANCFDLDTQFPL